MPLALPFGLGGTMAGTASLRLPVEFPVALTSG